MKDNITPEEKLLKLIRNESKKNFTPPPKQAVVNTVHPELALKPSKNRQSLLIQKYLSFLSWRKIIYVIFAISCLYLLISFIYPLAGLKNIKLPQPGKEKPIELNKELRQEIKPYEFYLEGIKNRRIFANPSGQEKEAEKLPAAADASLIKDINLVGIVSGNNPQAVIEDKKSQKTYYLTKGQFIGELMIDDIGEGKIILSCRGQKYELYL